MSKKLLHMLKVAAFCIEIAIVIGVTMFFVFEGFSGNSVLNVILVLLGLSSLLILVTEILGSRKDS